MCDTTLLNSRLYKSTSVVDCLDDINIFIYVLSISRENID